jgi:hypothetical protein
MNGKEKGSEDQREGRTMESMGTMEECPDKERKAKIYGP